MSKNPTLPENQHQNTSKLPQKIPITYLWFGKEVPEDYLISLSQLDYPVIFLKNPPIQRKFSREILEIQKSDFYRLQYLYDNGGIYSDFDNIINYKCLMNLLRPYRNQDKLVFMSVGNHTRAKLKQMTNNLIFAPYPRMPILKKILDGVNQKKGKIWDFAGMRYVAKFSQPVEVNMDRCVKHTGDWSWFNASNQVLKKKTPPHGRYAQKLTKKRDIIDDFYKLEDEMNEVKLLKDQMNKELSKIKAQNHKLKEQINVTKTSVSKQVIQKLKAQDQHKANVVGMEMSKDKLMVQNELEYLTERTEQLQFEKDAFMLATGGSVVLLLVFIIIGMLLLRKSKARQFSHVDSSKTIVYQ